MEKCYFCKGRIVREKVQHLHKWSGKYILFENIEAEVCKQCGEVYFSPEVLEMMDTKTKEMSVPKKVITIPVIAV